MQTAIYHEANKINLNGFIGWNDNNQVQTKMIYWKWNYETGSTQTEINNNDIADSFWMGKPISLSMNVTAKQVNENPTAGQYAVTLDSNGGAMLEYGNSSQVNKMVSYGDEYGNLPTPTREGYIFDGWITEHVTINSKVSGPATTNSAVFAGYNEGRVYPGITYTIIADSISLIEGSQTKYSTLVYDYTEQATKKAMSTDFGANIEYTIEIPESLNPEHNLRLLFYVGVVGNTLGNKIEIVNFKSIGRYTEQTKMLRNENHTLTAKWIKIE